MTFLIRHELGTLATDGPNWESLAGGWEVRYMVVGIGELAGRGYKVWVRGTAWDIDVLSR